MAVHHSAPVCRRGVSAPVVGASVWELKKEKHTNTRNNDQHGCKEWSNYAAHAPSAGWEYTVH